MTQIIYFMTLMLVCILLFYVTSQIDLERSKSLVVTLVLYMLFSSLQRRDR